MMITLYGTGRRWGLPDASPFVTKAEVLLKMAGLPYETKAVTPREGPKHKVPFIRDGGKVIADSTFIRFHLEDTYGILFDRGLTDVQKATAWAVEKMCEDHLYWAVLETRWCEDGNFRKGPREFFSEAPAPLRAVLARLIRGKIRRDLYGQGMGRHSRKDIETLAKCDISALSVLIGDKPWLMGDAPCGADATVFAFVAGGLCPLFDTPIRTAAEAHANLVAYRDRGMALWFPDLPKT